MKADWSQADPAINKMLAQHFSLVYFFAVS